MTPWILSPKWAHTFAERTRGLGRELACEILGNHGHAASSLDIAPSQVASRNQPRAHAFEVAGRDELVSALRRRVCRRLRLAFDLDGPSAGPLATCHR